MDGLVIGLMTWICALTGYAIPATPPNVQFVTTQFIRDTMCEGRECRIMGMYLHGDTIYLAMDLDVNNDVYSTSILLHELVHYAQEQSGRFPDRDCPTWLAEEREAYAVQAAWLRQRNMPFPMRRQIPSGDFCEMIAARESR